MRLPVCAALLLLAVPALAQEATESRALSGAEIAALVSGQTVEGAMTAGGPYRETYLPDGTIRGADYEGRWSVVGDTLCFEYDPAEEANCWGAEMGEGEEIRWVRDGRVEGTGRIARPAAGGG